jgi:arylsulfatase A-like enzyme
VNGRPNVLVFCTDEMRADHMACAGNAVVRTPNLDRLAARGVLFTRSYCANPICMPARASMFTGLLPRDHGVRVNGQALRRDLPTLPQVLADAGYRTHAAGKLHLTPWVSGAEPPEPERFPEDLQYWRRGLVREFPEPYYGFRTVDFVGGHTSYAYGEYVAWLEGRGGDREMLTPERARETPSGARDCYKMSLPEEVHYNRYIADSVIALIEESKGEDAPPFFVWCSFPDPHLPFAPPAPYCDMYDPAQVRPPVGREGELDSLPPFYRKVFAGEVRPNGIDNTGIADGHWREMIALTYGMVTHVDREIGRVLDALATAGLVDETLVVFLSDHGDMMGDHGHLMKAFYTFEGCIKIPTIVALPGAARGRRTGALVSQIDLMPSILDICGVEMPGSDWRKRETPFERGSLVPLRTQPGRSWRPILEGRAECIRDEVVIENDDPTTGLQARTLVTGRHRLTVYPGTPDGELFDLEADPRELLNLWYKADAARLRSEIVRRLLDAYAGETPFFPVPAWNA